MQGNIFLPEKVNAFLYAAQVGEIFVAVELCGKRVFNQLSVKLIRIRLDLGLNFCDKKYKCLFQLFILCVIVYAYLEAAGIFTYYGLQLAHILQPFFQFRLRGGRQGVYVAAGF